MPDEIDRDQEFNEQRLEAMIEQSRFRPASATSRYFCRFCGTPIPDKRRQALAGVTTCTRCQSILERRYYR